MPLITSTAPTISATGATAPTYADILAFLQNAYASIFGADVVLDSSTMDGQFLAVIASAINDTNNACLAAVASFSPATAVGAALSSNVKLNGISREPATYSTVDVTVTGSVGTVLTNAVVSDGTNRWNLPASVTIPSGGMVTVTATSQTLGAVNIDANATWTINTPTLGWQSVSNASASTPGNPVETNAQLRVRQASSTALPSLTVLDGIIGAVSGLPGVTRLTAYENDTASTDANGIPSHSISMVVEGGDATAIAQTIAAKKTPGAGTYGTTSVTITDIYGISRAINFYRPVQTVATVEITLRPLAGYTANIRDSIAAAVVAHINALPIGQNVRISNLYLPALLFGAADSATYEITALTGGNGSASDLVVPFNGVAYCDPATGVTITVA